jgi:CRP-like cAMP-binding protein
MSVQTFFKFRKNKRATKNKRLFCILSKTFTIQQRRRCPAIEALSAASLAINASSAIVKLRATFPKMSRVLNRKNADVSISLKESEKEDDSELAAENEDEQFEDLLEERRVSTIWSEGGRKKDEVLRKLIKLFGSFVVKFEDDDDEVPEMLRSKTYQKAPNAHQAVLKARV